jgi:hypothetical protein
MTRFRYGFGNQVELGLGRAGKIARPDIAAPRGRGFASGYILRSERSIYETARLARKIGPDCAKSQTAIALFGNSIAPNCNPIALARLARQSGPK